MRKIVLIFVYTNISTIFIEIIKLFVMKKSVLVLVVLLNALIALVIVQLLKCHSPVIENGVEALTWCEVSGIREACVGDTRDGCAISLETGVILVCDGTRHY